jgi:hypothetical protein
MKFGNPKKGLVLCASLLSFVLIGSVQAQTREGQAVARTVKGAVDYSEGGGTWTQLESGRTLRAGTVIRTGADSYVDLDLGKNGPGLRVTQNTTLGLDKLLVDDTGPEDVLETQLDLKSGCVAGRVGKSALSSRYEIKTPNAVAGVKGYGEYQMCADGRLSVGRGSAVVVYVSATGQTTTYVVNEGQAFDPSIPGVRGATPDELELTKMVIAAPTEVARFVPSVEPYVSPISPLDATSSSSSAAPGQAPPPQPTGRD